MSSCAMASDAPPLSATAWHSLATDAAAAQLGTDPALGLSEAEVAARLERHGPNQISETASRSKLRMLLAQFTDFMILLLVAAAIVSGFIGEVEDTIVILGIVVLNAAVGFVQEFRADHAIAALKQLASPSAMVVRAGRQLSVSAEALVPGDVVILQAGNAVPADLRLLDAVDLRLGEAALTGESLPVEKDTDPIGEPDLPLADRHNMAFKGTSVLYGRGLGVVVADRDGHRTGAHCRHARRQPRNANAAAAPTDRVRTSGCDRGADDLRRHPAQLDCCAASHLC